jgi:hypothetical protein
MSILEIFTNKHDQLDYGMHASFVAVFSALVTVLLVKCKYGHYLSEKEFPF